jgi:hypothetical protein
MTDLITSTAQEAEFAKIARDYFHDTYNVDGRTLMITAILALRDHGKISIKRAQKILDKAGIPLDASLFDYVLEDRAGSPPHAH